jgi:hypothetical protein
VRLAFFFFHIVQCKHLWVYILYYFLEGWAGGCLPIVANFADDLHFIPKISRIYRPRKKGQLATFSRHSAWLQFCLCLLFPLALVKKRDLEYQGQVCTVVQLFFVNTDHNFNILKQTIIHYTSVTTKMQFYILIFNIFNFF